MDYNKVRQTIEDILKSRGLSYEATFIPQSQSVDPSREALNWKITIGRFVCDYSQGIGHIPAVYISGRGKLSVTNTRRTLDMDRAIKWVCETGKVPTISNGKPLPKPDLLDVVYCITLDANIFDYATFEDCAHDYGYHPDSRAAEKIYNKCLSQSLLFSSVVGRETVETFRELLQDY